MFDRPKTRLIIRWHEGGPLSSMARRFPPIARTGLAYPSLEKRVRESAISHDRLHETGATGSHWPLRHTTSPP